MSCRLGELLCSRLWLLLDYVYFITHSESIGAGTVFRLGEQKLVQKQPRQSNSEYDFVQGVFFEKDMYKAARSWGVLENFCAKNNLTVCKVTFNCEVTEKKYGSRMY